MVRMGYLFYCDSYLSAYHGNRAHTSTVRFLAKPCASNRCVPPFGIASD
jgi:hypothetical protein